MKKKVNNRKRRSLRTKRIISNSDLSHVLIVHKSSRHLYAQIAEKVNNHIQIKFALSTLHKDIFPQLISANTQHAYLLGQEIAKKCLNNDIQQVAFDRSGFAYHGKIKAIADAARNNGLKL